MVQGSEVQGEIRIYSNREHQIRKHGTAFFLGEDRIPSPLNNAATGSMMTLSIERYSSSR
jgi:hypothetical protein